MQKLFLFAVLGVALLFTNCKKDKTPEELLIGKWKATKMVTDGEDIIQGTDDYKSAVELEFTKAGSLIFTITELDLTTTPPEESTFSIAGSYSWSGDNQLTITINDGGDILTVTGTADVTSGRFLFTATSGDLEDFFGILEADRI